MTDEELLVELEGTAARIRKPRLQVDARNALMTDVRDTAIEVARRAVAAILAAV